jgi:hypothetical protein
VPRFEYAVDPQPHGRRYNVAVDLVFADTWLLLALVAILLLHGAVLPQDALRKEMRHIAGASERALRDFAMYRSVVRNRGAMHVETAQTCVVSTLLHPLT